MTEAHVMAIADTPGPPDLVQETAASAKAKAKPAPKQPPRPSATPSSRSTSSTSSVRPPEPARAPKQPPTPPPGRGGKDHSKGIAEATRIVAVIGITLETDDGDNPN